MLDGFHAAFPDGDHIDSVRQMTDKGKLNPLSFRLRGKTAAGGTAMTLIKSPPATRLSSKVATATPKAIDAHGLFRSPDGRCYRRLRLPC